MQNVISMDRALPLSDEPTGAQTAHVREDITFSEATIAVKRICATRARFASHVEQDFLDGIRAQVDAFVSSTVAGRLA